MSTAPIDGSEILLYTRVHGITQAHFDKGGRHDMTEGPEYDAPVWVCGDDAWQIEVEWCGNGDFYHAEALAWQPLPAPPPIEEDDS
jgi:hypothetical protein